MPPRLPMILGESPHTAEADPPTNPARQLECRQPPRLIHLSAGLTRDAAPARAAARPLKSRFLAWARLLSSWVVHSITKVRTAVTCNVERARIGR